MAIAVSPARRGSAPKRRATRRSKAISVAERSFSLNDGVEMFVKPMPQPILRRRRQLQDETRKTQGLKDFKIAPRIHNDMRAAATKLVKRQGLPRLVGKTCAGLRVGKQMSFMDTVGDPGVSPIGPSRQTLCPASPSLQWVPWDVGSPPSQPGASLPAIGPMIR
jgi:hypothetical protein